MSDEDEGNPTPIREGSPMDTDEGTIHKHNNIIVIFGITFLELHFWNRL